MPLNKEMLVEYFRWLAQLPIIDNDTGRFVSRVRERKIALANLSELQFALQMIVEAYDSVHEETFRTTLRVYRQFVEDSLRPLHERELTWEGFPTALGRAENTANTDGSAYRGSVRDTDNTR